MRYKDSVHGNLVVCTQAGSSVLNAALKHVGVFYVIRFSLQVFALASWYGPAVLRPYLNLIRESKGRPLCALQVKGYQTGAYRHQTVWLI